MLTNGVPIETFVGLTASIGGPILNRFGWISSLISTPEQPVPGAETEAIAICRDGVF